MKTYLIKDLEKSRDLFDEFRGNLPYDWKKNGGCWNVDSFVEEFDRRDRSREIYPEDARYSGFGGCADDKKLYADFKGDAKIEEYAEVEIGSVQYIRLYGYSDYYDWQEDEECYGSQTFGDYYKVEIDL